MRQKLIFLKKLDTVFGVSKRYGFRTRHWYSDSAHPVSYEHHRFASLAFVCDRVHIHACPRALARRRARQRAGTCARAGVCARSSGCSPSSASVRNVSASSFGIAAPRPHARKSQPKFVRPKLIFGAAEINCLKKLITFLVKSYHQNLSRKKPNLCGRN